MIAVPHPSVARLLRGQRSVRRRRRLHHRARDQPDVRRADRPVGGLGLAPDGLAAADPPGGARSRPRQHDAGRAAGRACDAGVPRRRCGAFRRDQPAPGAAPARVPRRPRHTVRLAQVARRRAGRPDDHPGQRILRFAAGPSGRDVRRRLARARRQDRREREAALRHRPRSDSAVRAAAAARNAGRRSARSSNGAPTRPRSSSAAG